MLSPECVSREFTKLRSWSGQPPLDPTFLEEIYDGLQAQNINDHELVAAAKAWRFKSRFFPAPQELLEMLKVDSKNQALLDWAAITHNTSNGPTPGLTELGRKVLQAIGGRWVIQTEPAGVVRKRFLETYEAFSKKEASEQIKAAATTALPPSNVVDISSIGRQLNG